MSIHTTEVVSSFEISSTHARTLLKPDVRVVSISWQLSTRRLPSFAGTCVPMHSDASIGTCIRANPTLRTEIIVIPRTVGGGMTRKLSCAMPLSHYSSARAPKENCPYTAISEKFLLEKRISCRVRLETTRKKHSR